MRPGSAPCSLCPADLARSARRRDASSHGLRWLEVSITSEGLADLACEHGQRVPITVRGGRLALVYERALLGAARGARREALVDASAALEMYLESIPIRCFYEANGGDLGVIRTSLESALQGPDRALGAASASFAIRTGRALPTLPPSIDTLRADTLLRGHAPTARETDEAVVALGELVLEIESALATHAPATSRSSYWWMLHARSAQHARRDDAPSTAHAMGLPHLTLDFVVQPTLREPPRARLEDYRRTHACPGGD